MIYIFHNQYISIVNDERRQAHFIQKSSKLTSFPVLQITFQQLSAVSLMKSTDVVKKETDLQFCLH